MMLENLDSPTHIWQANHDVPVEPSRPSKSLVKRLGEVCGPDTEGRSVFEVVRFDVPTHAMMMTPSICTKPSSSTRSWLRVCFI